MATGWTWRRIAADGIIAVFLTYVLRWIWKLAEDAGLGLVNDLIGEFVGPMLAPYTSFLFAWGPPLALVVIALVAYHYVNKHLVRGEIKPLDSFDNTIEFDWGRAPSNSVVPPDGKYFDVTLAPLPEEVLRGGPMTVSTAPGSPLRGDNRYLCRIINHGSVPIFNALITLGTTFWESEENAKPSAVLTGPGPMMIKGQGKELISRPWNVSIPKVEPGSSNPFVFYLSSPNQCFVRVGAPKTISFQRLGRNKVETAELIAPHRLELIIPPPMNVPQPSRLDAPNPDQAIEWLPLKEAAQAVYDTTRHTLLSGISRRIAETDAEIIRETAETVFRRAEKVRGRMTGATSFDEIGPEQRSPLVVFDDVKSVGHNGMLRPEFCDIEVHEGSLQAVIDYITKIENDVGLKD